MPQIQADPLTLQLLVPGAAPNLTMAVERMPELLETLLTAVSSDTGRVRLGAIKALRILSGRAPYLIYPHFDFFAHLLQHENSILRWNAMLILGNMAAVDGERRTERIIDEYLAPISGPHLIDAASTIRGANVIAAAKPHLAEKIAGQILRVERANYATPECRNVAIGHAINCFERLFPMLANKRAVQRFVSRQIDNRRPATRKKAQRFLREWPIHHRA